MSPKDFEAPEMQSGQHCDRRAGIHSENERWRKVPAEIYFVVHDHIGKVVQFCSIGSAYMRVGHVHVANISKALGPQQFLKNLRRDAGDRVLCEADRGDFWRWLRGK
jgi:hypothetical protein